MKFTTLVQFLIVFQSSLFFGQQKVIGKITHEGQPIINATILLKRSNSELVLKYTKSNEDGFYSILMNSEKDSLVIEVSAFNYESNQKDLFKNTTIENLQINFELVLKTINLQEVLIKEKLKFSKVKNDTTVFDPKKFKDGTEKVVEDLLKKIPGIKIAENGDIKINGKSIKKMLLDGDDLFDNQYTIGSRNINVDMIEKVEIIENYNENSVLRNIAQNNDVALNLRFKKGPTDYSGNAQIGYGIEKRYDAKFTLLRLNSKTKTFGLSSYNNIGNNYSPFDLQSSIQSVESGLDNDLIAKQIINQGNFSSSLPNKFHRINSDFFSSINNLYKISKKVTIASNFLFYNDRLTRQNTGETKFTANNDNFSFSTIENIVKSHKIINGGVRLSSKNNINQNWEYDGKINLENLSHTSSSQNNDLLQKNQVATNSFLTKHKFVYAKKINDSTAFITIAIFSKSEAPQIFDLTPGLSTTFSDNITTTLQKSKFNKTNFKLKVELLGTGNKLKYNCKVGYLYFKNIFESMLTFNDENGLTINNEIVNNYTNFNYNLPFAESSINYSSQNIVLKLGLNLQYFKINLNDKTQNFNYEKKTTNLNPSAIFIYKLSSKSSIQTSYVYDRKLPSEELLFEGKVLTSFRDFQNNKIALDFLKAHRFSIGYRHRNSVYLSNFNIFLTINRRENNYFSNSIISTNSSISNKFLANIGNQDIALNLSGENYIDFLKTTLTYNANITVSNDNNIVNNSEIRKIENRGIDIELTLRKKLLKKLFLENIFIYNKSIFIVSTETNSFNALENSFKSAYQFNTNFRTALTFDFLAPDLSNCNNYFFANAEITFTSKNKKYDFSIIGRNLTNNKFFATTSVSDFSRTVSSHNLVSLYIMASISFQL
jgi:hypothetical protein